MGLRRGSSPTASLLHTLPVVHPPAVRLLIPQPGRSGSSRAVRKAKRTSRELPHPSLQPALNMEQRTAAPVRPGRKFAGGRKAHYTAAPRTGCVAAQWIQALMERKADRQDVAGRWESAAEAGLRRFAKHGGANPQEVTEAEEA